MAQFDFESIIQVLKDTLPKDRGAIGLHEPYFKGNEWAYVKDCLDTGWVSSVGKYVDRFERMLVDSTGVQNAIAVSNGTAALHICLKLVGVEPNDEVLAPSLTFVATANAITYCQAIPHFVDCDERSLGVDVQKLKKYLSDSTELKSDGCYNKKSGRRIKALICMHAFGHSVDLDPLAELAKNFKIELIEDAAESLGSYYKGKHTGNWGRVSALSFNGNKITTTGGGGAILTNDRELAKLAKHLTTTAKVPHQWAYDHDMIGYNYRLPNINAALGCAQLEQLPEFRRRKRSLAHKYENAFASVKGVRFFVEPNYGESNYWLNALILNPEHAHERDVLLKKTHENGLFTRPAWVPMHKLPMFVNCPKMSLEKTLDIEQRLINIPSSVFLTE